MSHKIENWQNSVPDGNNAEPSSATTDGLASRLTRATCEVFGFALQHAKRQTSKAVFRALKRQYGYLQLWCDGYGVAAGDLDDVIDDSRRLRHSHLSLAGQPLPNTDRKAGGHAPPRS
ncbi:hypothetical protein N658DRAFT_265334 [Parathielavia hyrcaniae]|uniref:Uncharacterized protein n=1 Tax=Parathielavia hyrcaniae TaxID=113614 RepID=A0AAN6PTY4_9PEZI|nr:hypothetical protein N658DRAFT_265334 [Parathielavia hyrcaniae]